MVTKHILVEGKVQGVGFRHHTLREAQSLSLEGWVRNLADGRVEILACGDRDRMESFLAWLHRGPAAAQVKSVTVQDSHDQRCIGSGFNIRHGGGS